MNTQNPPLLSRFQLFCHAWAAPSILHISNAKNESTLSHNRLHPKEQLKIKTSPPQILKS